MGTEAWIGEVRNMTKKLGERPKIAERVSLIVRETQSKSPQSKYGVDKRFRRRQADWAFLERKVLFCFRLLMTLGLSVVCVLLLFWPDPLPIKLMALLTIRYVVTPLIRDVASPTNQP